MRGWLERWARGRIVRRPLGAEFDRRFFYASPEAALCWALPWASAELDKGFMSFCREFYNPAMWSMILGGIWESSPSRPRTVPVQRGQCFRLNPIPFSPA